MLEIKYGFLPKDTFCDITGEKIKMGDTFTQIFSSEETKEVNLDLHKKGSLVLDGKDSVILSKKGIYRLSRIYKNIKLRRLNSYSFGENKKITKNKLYINTEKMIIEKDIENYFIEIIEGIYKFLDDLNHRRINKFVSLRKFLKNDKLIKQTNRNPTEIEEEEVISFNNPSSLESPLVVKRSNLSDFLEEFSKSIDNYKSGEDFSIKVFDNSQGIENENTCVKCKTYKNLICIFNIGNGNFSMCTKCANDMIKDINNYSEDLKYQILIDSF